MLNAVFILFSVAITWALPARAQTDPKAGRLILEYMNAIKLENPELINAAWENLSESKEALTRLKREYPRVYKSYEYWRMKRELEELKARRFLNSSFRGLSTKGASSGIGTSRGHDRSNSQRVRDFSNEDQRSNRSRVMSFPNQRRRSNSETVGDIPNQERLSNQERIRNRLRSLR